MYRTEKWHTVLRFLLQEGEKWTLLSASQCTALEKTGGKFSLPGKLNWTERGCTILSFFLQEGWREGKKEVEFSSIIPAIWYTIIGEGADNSQHLSSLYGIDKRCRTLRLSPQEEKNMCFHKKNLRYSQNLCLG